MYQHPLSFLIAMALNGSWIIGGLRIAFREQPRIVVDQKNAAHQEVDVNTREKVVIGSGKNDQLVTFR